MILNLLAFSGVEFTINHLYWRGKVVRGKVQLNNCLMASLESRIFWLCRFHNQTLRHRCGLYRLGPGHHLPWAQIYGPVLIIGKWWGFENQSKLQGLWKSKRLLPRSEESIDFYCVSNGHYFETHAAPAHTLKWWILLGGDCQLSNGIFIVVIVKHLPPLKVYLFGQFREAFHAYITEMSKKTQVNREILHPVMSRCC